VGDGGLSILARHSDLEDTKVVLGHGRRIAVPIVEVTNEIGAQSIWGPLAVYDVAVGLDIEAKLLVALKAVLATRLLRAMHGTCPREFLHAALGLLDGLDPLLGL